MRRAGGGRRESCFPSLRKGVLFEDLFPSLWMKQETFLSPGFFDTAWAARIQPQLLFQPRALWSTHY